MGLVVLHGGAPHTRHEHETRVALARKLAAIKGYEFAGAFDPEARYAEPLYFVPGDTIEHGEARTVGIQTEHDLFGGVVPRRFAATKVITHPLISERAHAPPGWSARFARAVGDVVLAGYAAFAIADARDAGDRLLGRGALRLKLPDGVGGRGQRVVRDRDELADFLAGLDPERLAAGGLVLEEHLEDIETYSVGQVRVDELMVSYVGTQRLTQDHAGSTVYGGTALVLARGDFDALHALDLGPAERDVIAKARVYDRAADAAYPGFFASRRNYDVARGRTGRDEPRAGVLEQSWRMGGASGIEIAALRTFRDDPDVIALRGSCREIYGDPAELPRDAEVYFDGRDDAVGRLVKYTVVDEHVRR